MEGKKWRCPEGKLSRDCELGKLMKIKLEELSRHLIRSLTMVCSEAGDIAYLVPWATD